MSKKGLLALGIIFFIQKNSSALSNPVRDIDSINSTGQVLTFLQGDDNRTIIRGDNELQADLRLHEPFTRRLNQFGLTIGGVDGSVPRIRRRRWTNGTSDESLENGIDNYMGEPPISMLWKVLTTPLFIAGNAITAPITSFADRVNVIAVQLSAVLLAMIWSLTKNVVLPNVDNAFTKLAHSHILPEYLNQLITMIHFCYEMLKTFGYWTPAS